MNPALTRVHNFQISAGLSQITHVATTYGHINIITNIVPCLNFTNSRGAEIFTNKK